MPKGVDKSSGQQPPTAPPSPSETGQAKSVPKVNKTTEKLWELLSADLRRNPEGNWKAALANADELSRSICGQDYADDELRSDILFNINMLERTLMGLKFTSSDHPETLDQHIQQTLFKFRLSVSSSSEHIRKIEALKKDSSTAA